MLKAPKHQSPRVINVDRSNAYPPAIEELKKEGMFPMTSQLRQCRYLNNLIEQDHRFIKRRVNPGLGFSSFNTARRTISGYEAMHMIRKVLCPYSFFATQPFMFIYSISRFTTPKFNCPLLTAYKSAPILL